MARAFSHTARIERFGQAAVSTVFLSLSYPDYRTLWWASFLGGAAASGLIVARGWMVFTLSHSSAVVGIATFAAMIPVLVVPPFVGLLADKLDRRTILASTFALNLGHNIILAILSFTGSLQVWHLIVLSLVNGVARAALMPTAQALVPNLVPPKVLPNAVALYSATVHGSKLVGPGVVALLLSISNPGSAFLVCTGFYGLGLWQVLRIQTASTGRLDPSKGLWSNLVGGLIYVYRAPLLSALLALVALHCALTMSFEAVLPVIARKQFSTGGYGFGTLMMAVGAGALISLVALAAVQNARVRGRLLLLAGLGSSLMLLALAAAPTLTWALVAAAGVGASQAAFMAITMSMIQSLVPDHIRGRVTSTYIFLAGGLMAFANLFYGAMADLISGHLVLLISGSVFLVLMLGSFFNSSLRVTYLRGRATPMVASG